MQIKKKLLLHICCASCGAFVTELLQKNFEVVLYYYNPNIFPFAENEKRLAWVDMIAKKLEVEVIYGDYDHVDWLKKIKGYEKEPEKGERCFICYEDRLKAAAQRAVLDGFDFFTTTLTVSPHKATSKIMEIGKDLAEKYDIDFVDQDFKKKDGFKKSVQKSKQLGIYRQNYCGCEFSRREED